MMPILPRAALPRSPHATIPPMSTDTGDLLHSARMLPPDLIAAHVSTHAASAGAIEAQVFLVDRSQRTLSPLSGLGERLAVVGSLAGLVFSGAEAQWTERIEDEIAAAARLWQPLSNGLDRLGVLALTYPARPAEADAPAVEAAAVRYASMVAALVVLKSFYGDGPELARRTHAMSVAAELQWSLLPPRSFGTAVVGVSGAMEPAYDIGGDSFDYALDGDHLHVALFDAMGHGLVAATLAATTVACYRHGRRAGHELPGLAAELDEMIDTQTGGERFVTAWLGRLDVPTGRLCYLNIGHPPALLLRDGHVVKELEAAPELPLGLGTRVDELALEDLEPGDRVLAYTDGVVEARSTEHGYFGEARLIDFLEREAASGHDGPEILRRLTRAVVEHQEGQLQDDSSMVLLEWRGGAEYGIWSSPSG